jgi:hypothetical protein
MEANGATADKSVSRRYVEILKKAPYELMLDPSQTRNVFFCQTVDELRTLWTVFRNAQNYRSVNHETQGYFSVGMQWMLRYLEQRTCSKHRTPMPSRSIMRATGSGSLSLTGLERVDLDTPEEYGQTVPVSCMIRNACVIREVQSWPQMLVAIVEHFISENEPNLESLVRTSLYGMQYFFQAGSGHGRRVSLSNGKWILVDYPPKIVVRIIAGLFRHCGIEFDEVELLCRRENSQSVPTLEQDRLAKQKEVDFRRPELYEMTIPVSCTIEGKKVVPKKQNWSQMLIAVVEHLIDGRNRSLTSLENTPLYGSQPFFKLERGKGQHVLLSNGRWIYANYSPKIIVRIIGNLFLHCGIPLDRVELMCIPKGYRKGAAQRSPSRDQRRTVAVSRMEKQVDEDLRRVLAAIVGERFPNGIRPKSIIDINKIRHYYREEKKVELSLAEGDIQDALEAIGTSFRDKVYVISSAGKLAFRDLVEDLISQGHNVFFYDRFLEVHHDTCRTYHVYSSELLQTVLREVLPSLFFSHFYFASKRSATLQSEILRCYEGVKCCSYEELQCQLTYTPMRKIRHFLASNPDFVRVGNGIFAHIRKIDFDDRECSVVRNAIERAVSKDGYAALGSFSIPSSVDRNPELSETAMKNAFFQRYLSTHYARCGNVVMERGASASINTLIKNYCMSNRRLTLEQLTQFTHELAISSPSQALQVACENMVRVDEQTFVADGEIGFPTRQVDIALDRLVHRDVVSLQDIKSLTSLPYIHGYNWNVFLLASYCRRFSERFDYMALSANISGVGAIVRKSANFTSYVDALAYVVVVSSIDLIESQVGDYLRNNGYVASRTKKTITNVINKARALRARRQ